MSDFFDKKQEEKMDEPQAITINGKEYSQDDLNQLVGLGEQSRDLETKWSTKIDSLMPAYTKTTQELAELRKEKNQWLESQIPKKEPKEPQNDEERQALELSQAKTLLKDKMGVVTNDDFESKFRNRYVVERQAEKLNESLNGLASEIDGADGRPKFNAQEILDFMSKSNIPDPNFAYKLKYEKELDAWKEQQFASVKRPGIYTEDKSSLGSKQPPAVKPTKDNLIDLIKETMGD